MKKDFSVIWGLDGESMRKLTVLAQAAAGDAPLPSSLHPHITLGTYEDIEEHWLRRHVAAFAQTVTRFPVRFEEVGLLSPGCAVCFPAFVGGLREHYLRFHRRLDRYADRWTSLQRGLYTPHVSLYGCQSRVERPAQRRLSEAFRPFDGQVVSLALSWIRGEEDYEILAEHQLG